MKKKKRLRSWLGWFCMAFMMLGLVLVPNISSKASNEAEACLYDRIHIDDGKTRSWTYSTVKSQKSTNKRTDIGLYNLNEYINTKKAAGWKIKDVQVSSSNKAVAAVSLSYKSEGGYYMNLELLKGGSSKITVTAKAVKGKKKNTYKQTFTMKSVKYENPFKSLKIGGKEYASKYKNVCSVTQNKNREANNTLKIKLKKGQTKPKLQYKLNKNWKVVSAYAYDNDDNRQQIKSGSTLGNNMALSIMVQNKKTGVTERTVITIGNGSYPW